MPSLKALSTDSECPPLEKGTLRIYSNGICPYAQRTRIVLLHKNIPHEVVNVALSKWKPGWYLSKHPFGTVPCLEQDGKLVCDSVIASEYLDDVYPEPKLTPSDPYQRAKDKFLFEKWSKVVSLVYTVYKTQGQDEDVLKDIRGKLDLIESELVERGTPFFGGDAPMMIDFFIWPHMERLVIQKDLLSPNLALSPDRYPKIQEWIDRITSVPAVKETQLSAETHGDFFVSYAMGAPNYDVGLTEKSE